MASSHGVKGAAVTKRITVCMLSVVCLAAWTAPLYCDDAVQKLSRGICNVVTCYFEVFEQSKRVKEASGSVAGMTYGFAKGVTMTAVRALAGVYEIATFPLPYPKDYQPILKDPVSFFPAPPKKQ